MKNSPFHHWPVCIITKGFFFFFSQVFSLSGIRNLWIWLTNCVFSYSTSFLYRYQISWSGWNPSKITLQPDKLSVTETKWNWYGSVCASFLVQLYNSRNLLSEIIKNVKTLFILAARVNYRAVEIGSEQFNCFSINLQVVQTLSKSS